MIRECLIYYALTGCFFPVAQGPDRAAPLCGAQELANPVAVEAPRGGRELVCLAGGTARGTPGFFTVGVLTDQPSAGLAGPGATSVIVTGGAWRTAPTPVHGAAAGVTAPPGTESALVLLLEGEELVVVELATESGLTPRATTRGPLPVEVARVPFPEARARVRPGFSIRVRWTADGAIGLGGLADGTALRLRRLGGGRWEVGWTRLVDGATGEWPVEWYAPHPVLSGGGPLCYFGFEGPASGIEANAPEFYRLRLSGGADARVGKPELLSHGRWRLLLPSPDGRLIAAVGEEGDGVVFRGWRSPEAPLGSAEPLVRLPRGCRLLLWSPSGRRLAAQRIGGGGCVWSFSYGVPASCRAMPRPWSGLGLMPYWLGDDAIGAIDFGRRRLRVWSLSSGAQSDGLRW